MFVLCCCIAVAWFRFAGKTADEEFVVQFERTAQPLWTIDICHILQHHGVRYTFLTLCTGVNPEHFEDPWYGATNIREDQQRVERLFEAAKAEAWSVEKVSLMRCWDAFHGAESALLCGL